MKVVGRSDGGLMGGRKDRGREGQGQYGVRTGERRSDVRG